MREQVLHRRPRGARRVRSGQRGDDVAAGRGPAPGARRIFFYTCAAAAHRATTVNQRRARRGIGSPRPPLGAGLAVAGLLGERWKRRFRSRWEEARRVEATACRRQKRRGGEEAHHLRRYDGRRGCPLPWCVIVRVSRMRTLLLFSASLPVSHFAAVIALKWAAGHCFYSSTHWSRSMLVCVNMLAAFR